MHCLLFFLSPTASWMLRRHMFTGASKQRTLSNLPTPISPPIPIMPSLCLPHPSFSLKYFPFQVGKANSCPLHFPLSFTRSVTMLLYSCSLLKIQAKNTGIHQSHERKGHKIGFSTFRSPSPCFPLSSSSHKLAIKVENIQSKDADPFLPPLLSSSPSTVLQSCGLHSMSQISSWPQFSAHQYFFQHIFYSFPAVCLYVLNI